MIDAAGLRMIRAIAEQGSFTAAALHLGYTQPAVSQMIKRMENRLGIVLIERHGRRVRLTEAGQVLAETAVTVLDALADAEGYLADLTGLQAGRVRLIAFPSSCVHLVPRALAQVRTQHPGLQLSLTEAEPADALAALRAGQCDLAVTFSYPGAPISRGEELDDFVVQPLLSDPVAVALPKTHPLAKQTAIDVAQLSDDQWIAGDARSRGHLVQVATEAGFSPKISFEAQSHVTVQGFVAAGLGVALLSDLMRSATHNEQIVVLPLAQPMVREIHVVTTKDLARLPAVSATLTALKAAAHGLDPA